MRLSRLAITIACSLIIMFGYAVLAKSDTQTAKLRPVLLDSTSDPQAALQDWGEVVVSEGVTTTYAIYRDSRVGSFLTTFVGNRN